MKKPRNRKVQGTYPLKTTIDLLEKEANRKGTNPTALASKILDIWADSLRKRMEGTQNE